MEGEPHFTAYFRTKLVELIKAQAPDMPAEAPDELMERMLVSAFLEAVSWWFDHGCEAKPEQVANWFMLLLERK